MWPRERARRPAAGVPVMPHLMHRGGSAPPFGGRTCLRDVGPVRVKCAGAPPPVHDVADRAVRGMSRRMAERAAMPTAAFESAWAQNGGPRKIGRLPIPCQDDPAYAHDVLCGRKRARTARGLGGVRRMI